MIDALEQLQDDYFDAVIDSCVDKLFDQYEGESHERKNLHTGSPRDDRRNDNRARNPEPHFNCAGLKRRIVRASIVPL